MKLPLVPSMLALLLAGGPLSTAATIPYTNDFSGTGSNTAFAVENPTAEWAVTGGVYQYDVTATNNIPSIASLPITNAGGVPFTIQTQFTVDSAGAINSTAQTLGFGLFGLDTQFTGTGTGNAYYLADFSYADGAGAGVEGLLRILSLGDASGFTTTSTGLADNNAGSATLAVVLGTTYTLKLEGTYTGSTLNMTLGLFDAAGTTQIGTSAVVADTTPLTGTNFGYRNRRSIGGGAVDIAFDNFSVVPEPSTVAMLLTGLLIGLPRIRRRQPASLQ